jgi:recombination protein RecR
MICVVQDVADVWALERSGIYKGGYHILGGVLSALDGVGPEDLAINGLIRRLAQPNIQEVIFALSATVDGQATVHYITSQINTLTHLRISAVAHGIPLGGELDYLDDGTLGAALAERRKIA